MSHIKFLLMHVRWVVALGLLLLAAMPHALAAQQDAAANPLPIVSPTKILSPVAIYQRLAPSAVYIVTESSTGSGLLLPGGYVATNAHVLWPFTRAQVVTSDGQVFDDTPVAASDFLLDLAILGPIDTQLPPAPLADGEQLPVGASVYLLGYPAEGEPIPQPAIARGIISRMRTWHALGITYFQTDAAVAGGQSGGMLVAADGSVIGISGMSLADSFAVAASAADLAALLTNLTAGAATPGPAMRAFPLHGSSRSQRFQPVHSWDQRMYVIQSPIAQGDVDVSAESEGDALLFVTNLLGEYPLYLDDTLDGKETGTFAVESRTPYFLVAAPAYATPDEIAVTATQRLAPFTDPDDGRHIGSSSTTLAGILDYPGDIDFFEIDLRRGQTVTLTMTSMLVDAYLRLDNTPLSGNATAWDDDDGGGPFGTDAVMIYTPRRNSTSLIIAEDAAGIDTGGYLLTIEREPNEN